MVSIATVDLDWVVTPKTLLSTTPPRPIFIPTDTFKRLCSSIPGIRSFLKKKNRPNQPFHSFDAKGPLPKRSCLLSHSSTTTLFPRLRVLATILNLSFNLRAISRSLGTRKIMASEEPPSLRDNPQATDTRPGSAPALTSVTATSGVPTVNMNSTNDGTTAAQGSAAPADLAHPASGQQVNVSTEAKARLTDVIGQSGEHTPDMAGGSTQVDVKTDSEAEAFPPPTISDVSSDMIDQQHEGSPVKKENEADGFLLSNPQQQTKEITLDNVRKAADITDLAKLEAGTEEAREVLDSLRQPMADSEQREQLDWLNRIEKLKSQSNRTRTLVGVAGSTGAGKSSLINALLDEEKLLPTSGFRACTAVITEISYNESEDPWKAYRCVVEFLSRDDWISEVELLFGDLVEDKQLSPGYLDNNTVAGIAYAKIKAVRPDLTQDMIVKSTVEQLANSDAVAKVLGTTIHFACSNPRDLCKMLQKYLDSKDKDTKGGPRKEQDMAFWPLIKRVKVFTRASVLKTGVCIVDLPGIHDSNTASV